MANGLKHKELTGKIIRSFYQVYNELGIGFMETVYKNAMYFVLTNELNMLVKKEYPVNVFFRNTVVGHFKVDLFVEDKIIVELKAVADILPIHEAQIINYLKATDKEIGLLLNFGNTPQFKRYIFNK